MPRKNRIAIGKDFVDTYIEELAKSEDNTSKSKPNPMEMVSVSMPKKLLDRAMKFRKTRNSTITNKEPQYQCFTRIVKFYEENHKDA